MRSSNLWLMHGTSIIVSTMQLADLLREANGHPEIKRLPPKKQQALRVILTSELNFQREQLDKLLDMVTR